MRKKLFETGFKRINDKFLKFKKKKKSSDWFYEFDSSVYRYYARCWSRVVILHFKHHQQLNQGV